VTKPKDEVTIIPVRGEFNGPMVLLVGTHELCGYNRTTNHEILTETPGSSSKISGISMEFSMSLSFLVFLESERVCRLSCLCSAGGRL